MRIRAASEDFISGTLAAVPGAWRKLQYISRLRGPDGRYAHWGLIRLYGAKAVQTALAEAHREVFLEILRAPLPDLLQDVTLSAAESEATGADYLGFLCDRAIALIPDDVGGGSARHFNSILQALAAIARAPHNASRAA